MSSRCITISDALRLVTAAVFFAGAPLLEPVPGKDISAGSVAFVDVNVIPMDENTVLEHQNVIVRGDHIVGMGPRRQTRVPANAFTVDGRNRYLIPALTDMHVHMPDSDRDRKDELKLLYSNGIAVAVNMRGTPEILALRDEVNAGKLLGPTLYSENLPRMSIRP